MAIRIVAKALVGQRLQQKLNAEAVTELQVARLDDEDDDLDGPPPDHQPEPPELEDRGESSPWLGDGTERNGFAGAWEGSLPLVRTLPRRLRPPVLYALVGPDLELRVLGNQRSAVHDLEKAIAEAIRTHIYRNEVRLSDPGDWCDIPRIGTWSDLAALIPERLRLQLDESKLQKIGSVLRDFAIHLPNGDVVTPKALMESAVTGSKITRAAALRQATQALSGESGVLSPAERARFEETQRKKRYRRKKKLGEAC